MPVWLVTGGTGFLGRHVLSELQGDGQREVVALGRRRPPESFRGSHIAADLNDATDIARAVAETRPAVVIHTAGRTPPANSDELYRANTLTTVHLLDALRDSGRPVRVVLVGSAAELGPVEIAHLPVSEDHPCHPADAYGLSKLLATAAGLAARPPLDVSVARVFNPIGPGTPATQAFGKFAQRLAAPGPDYVRLEVGDLTTSRDFIDVRDVASALVAIALHGKSGLIYNVGTGRSHRVGLGLERLIELSGRNVEVVSQQVSRPGPQDSRADIRRIAEQTGWHPRISWEQSLSDLWDEARTNTNS
jgi:nucleoside-diphosphate-sugar epimerase